MNAIERLRGEAWGVNNRRQHEEDCDAVDALYQAAKHPDLFADFYPEDQAKAIASLAAAVRRVDGDA